MQIWKQFNENYREYWKSSVDDYNRQLLMNSYFHET